MKPFTHGLLTTCLALMLCACGSDNQQENNSQEVDTKTPDIETPEEPTVSPEEQPLPIIGTWQNTNEDGSVTYVSITETTFSSKTYIEDIACYSNVEFTIENLSETSFDALINNQVGNLGYTIENDTLTIDGEWVLTRSSNPPEFVSCADPSATGTIDIAIEFDHLPSSFSTPENLTDEYLESFSLSVAFDITPVDSALNKEINIYTEYNIQSGQAAGTVSMTDLSSKAYYYPGGDRDFYAAQAPYSILGNTLTLSIERSNNKVFGNITSTTPIQVSASFNDANGDEQVDFFPESGFTSGVDTSDLLDETGDVFGDYSTDTIVDIKSVSVVITE